jgi:hypothetical protein
MNIFSMTATLGLAVLPIALIVSTSPVQAILHAVGF